MNPENKTRLLRFASSFVLLFLLLMTTTGCQTFTLTKEEFARQQRGEVVDEEVGRVVQTVGTAGYYGALIGAAIANLK